MKKIHLKHISEQAENDARKFKQKDGSDHIAGSNALEAIYKIIQKENLKNILEFGSGIGTMSYFCLKNSEAKLDLYEENEFCLNEINKNLTGFENRYKIFQDKENFECRFDNYDLVIVDGGWNKLFKDLVKKAEIKQIFFEGKRRRAQLDFLRLLKNKYICQHYRYIIYKGEKSGYLMILEPEKNCLKRQLNFIFNRWNLFFENIRLYGFKVALYREYRGLTN